MRWLPGTRILTWVGTAGASRRDEVSGSAGRERAADRRRRRRDAAQAVVDAGAEAELVEPDAEIVGAAARAPRRAPAGRRGGS